MVASATIRLEDGSVIEIDRCNLKIETTKTPVYVFCGTTNKDELVDMHTTYTITADHFAYSVNAKDIKQFWKKLNRSMKKARIKP